MQQTIRVLRIALPVVFIAFVVLIVTSWNRRGGARPEQAKPVVSDLRPTDIPIAESGGFEDTQTIGGRVVSKIRAARVVAFESGWNTLEGVQLTIYRPNGLTYELICPQAQFNSTTKAAEAKGGVKVTSSDGIMISTPELTFDGNRLTNEIPVQFRIDRWDGNAGALDLDVQAETLKLAKKVTATMTPETPAEQPMVLTGEESVFRRRENDVTFTKAVSMTRGADRLSADRMAGRFTQNRKQLIGLEGDGHVLIVMAESPKTADDLGGRKEITCDRFFSEVAPNGEISAINAVGESAVAHAVIAGPPKRDLVARTFRIAIVNKAVHEIKATSEVVFKEIAEVTRVIRTEHATVTFDPIRHRASAAYIEPFRYSDPKSTATAFRAHYDIAGDRVVLTTDPGWDATVVSEGHTIKAKQIEFSPKAQIAKATGSVIAQLVNKGGGATADSTNLFPSGKPVFVNADSLVMRNATKVAYFTGNVKAWQETNTIFASELQVQGAGNTLTAKGGVRAVLYNTGEHRKIPMTMRSEQLVARKLERRMELTGGVRIEDDLRTMTSEKAQFFFDANRRIERIETDQKVNVVEKATGRAGSGEKATYLVQKRLVYVSGSPATVKGPQGTVNGQQIAMDLGRNRVEIVSPTSQTEGVYKHQPQ